MRREQRQASAGEGQGRQRRRRAAPRGLPKRGVWVADWLPLSAEQVYHLAVELLVMHIVRIDGAVRRAALRGGLREAASSLVHLLMSSVGSLRCEHSHTHRSAMGDNVKEVVESLERAVDGPLRFASERVERISLTVGLVQAKHLANVAHVIQ